jgi:malate dehydrogenase (oxaloacetate-decarboxylating)
LTEQRRRPLPRGQQLLELPQFNKGTAFTWEERLKHGLLGLLPPHEEGLEQQMARAYRAFQAKNSDIERHIYLRQLQDNNETLFYRLIMDYPAEMTPIIYTPTVGEACQRFSEIYRKPRGLFIAYPEREHIDQILDNAIPEAVEVIVMTDSEAILGIGDQGAGGMGIPIGKLALYTANGGIDPNRCLPILLDVGTNNQALLDDPFYIGWAHPRITGEDYYSFVDEVMQAIMVKFPDALVQFEDFGRAHAQPLLDRYRDQVCCFNDDIQGTAAVAMGTVMAGVHVAGSRFDDQVFVIAGAGSAGCGIAEHLVRGLVLDGVSEADAFRRFYLVDRHGLIRDGLEDLTAHQQLFVRTADELATWTLDAPEEVRLLDVVRNARPTVLVGVSGQGGLFSEAVVREMARINERPIIMPLSNPTARVEATPENIVRWSEGRALIATGSPFAPVYDNGIVHVVAQCNNSYAFPGMGLGALAVKARRISDEMFMAAARVIGAAVPVSRNPGAPLLPPLSEIRPLSRDIAIAVGRTAVEQGLSHVTDPEEVVGLVDARMWMPRYRVFA